MLFRFLKYLLPFILTVLTCEAYSQGVIVDTTKADTLIEKNIVIKEVDRETIKQKVAAAKDTIKPKLHSPRKAAWMSAALPGLGQIYNKKYWKLPIIYVGFGVIGYLGYDYYTKFNKYKETYVFRTGLDSTATDYFPGISSKELLYDNWNYYRRNFELTCIFGSLLYILNIVDAAVDGHLYKFDISNDLSMRIEPTMNSTAYNHIKNLSGGVKLTLKF
ncbi:MAG: DUF5683 domain-containing protein [Bacteroidales bacterium]|jgi:hypothetical protein|nr:DUF5683 domain-containing protein [Bacteroidales bacterium]MDD4215243.1 DUF5683 domain-containing protein [Bacteroidales bacterium]